MAPSSALIVSSKKLHLDARVGTESWQGKVKVQLKLAISRLRMVQQKDTAIAKQQRRSMAQLLEVCYLCLVVAKSL